MNENEVKIEKLIEHKKKCIFKGIYKKKLKLKLKRAFKKFEPLKSKYPLLKKLKQKKNFNPSYS